MLVLMKTIICEDARGTVVEHLRCGGYVVSGTEVVQECACTCHVPDEEQGLNPLSPRRVDWSLHYAAHHERSS
jgi:hypothetical protein